MDVFLPLRLFELSQQLSFQWCPSYNNLTITLTKFRTTTFIQPLYTTCRLVNQSLFLQHDFTQLTFQNLRFGSINSYKTYIAPNRLTVISKYKVLCYAFNIRLNQRALIHHLTRDITIFVWLYLCELLMVNGFPAHFVSRKSNVHLGKTLSSSF